MSIVAIIFILVLPRPERISGVHPDNINASDKTVSMFSMLKGNPTFVMLMLAMTFTFTGQSYFGFFINIIQNVGGNAANLGVTLFINAAVELLPMIFSFWLLRKFGNKSMLILAVTAFAIKTLLVSIAKSIVWIYIGSISNMFAS